MARELTAKAVYEMVEAALANIDDNEHDKGNDEPYNMHVDEDTGRFDEEGLRQYAVTEGYEDPEELVDECRQRYRANMALKYLSPLADTLVDVHLEVPVDSWNTGEWED